VCLGSGSSSGRNGLLTRAGEGAAPEAKEAAAAAEVLRVSKEAAAAAEVLRVSKEAAAAAEVLRVSKGVLACCADDAPAALHAPLPAAHRAQPHTPAVRRHGLVLIVALVPAWVHGA
jgi:hypothetical protein